MHFQDIMKGNKERDIAPIDVLYLSLVYENLNPLFSVLVFALTIGCIILTGDDSRNLHFKL